MTQNFDGEIKTLAYPQAALFSFTLALMAYNILATLKAALASVHGVGKIEAALSDFYVVNELQGTYSGSHSDKGQVNYSSLLISMAS